MSYLKRLALSAVIPGLLLSGAVFAQTASYPSRPVTMIVPLAAGGPLDVELRLYTPRLRDLLGQSFVVDYKLGASGTIAAAYVAKATPDGHTLLVVNNSFTIFPAIYKDLNFDVIKDFAPVSLVSKRPVLLLVSPAFPAKTYAEYIAYAKANTGKINYGTVGAGSGGHLGGAWLHSATSTKVTFIHYKGMGVLLPDMLAGRVDATGVALSQALPQVKNGKLHALAMMSDKRTPLLPDLATVAEQGIPGYDYSSYTAFLAPGATPAANINKLSDAFGKILKSPDVISRLEADGGVAIGNTPAQFRQQLIAETARWQKLVQDFAIKLEE